MSEGELVENLCLIVTNPACKFTNFVNILQKAKISNLAECKQPRPSRVEAELKLERKLG